MNVLGSLPAASSDGAALNKLDMLKVLRMVLVQLISLFVTLAVPAMLHTTYVFKGVDYTAYILIAVNCLAEMARRWLSGQPTAPIPVSVAASSHVQQTVAPRD